MNISREELISILDELGIEVTGETSTDIVALCPFHQNRNTGSFNISKETGLFKCWNPSCAYKGSLNFLISKIKGIPLKETFKYVKFNPDHIFNKPEKKKEPYKILSLNELDSLDYSKESLIYLKGRGLTLETVRYFGIGYKDEYLYFPVYDYEDQLVGFARRSVISKIHFDSGLPKKYVLYNLNNAKGNEEVILVEGQIDAMKVHQAGFPNVAAVMSGNITDFQADLLRKHFKGVILFFDNDQAGRDLLREAEKKCAGTKTYRVPYLYDVKDPGAMTEEQIQKCIDESKTSLISDIERILGGNDGISDRTERTAGTA